MNKMILHDSSIRHATGQAIYIDDMPAFMILFYMEYLFYLRMLMVKLKKLTLVSYVNLPFYSKIITGKRYSW